MGATGSSSMASRRSATASRSRRPSFASARMCRPRAAMLVWSSLPATLLPDDGWLIRSRETFDSVSSWPAQEQPGWGAGYQDGRYWLKLDGQQTISYRIPLEATEFRISADVQAQGGYAGLVFLAS